MKTIYKGDTRYEKVYEQMQLLGIQDVSTPRQVKNGTIVWRLPILSDRAGRYIEYASSKSGYVRNQGVDCHSNWQINKRVESEPQYYPEYEWKTLDNGDYTQVKTGKYRKFTTRGCKLIPNEADRLEYLIAFCLKNYYIGQANMLSSGMFVPRWKYEELEKSKKIGWNYGNQDEISVTINGHRYNLT